MAPKDFFSLYHITVEFITKLEQYNTRHIATLRGALAAQCKSFLHAFHTDKITVMSMLLENEQWEVAVVPREFQAMVDTLASPTTVAATALAAQTTHASGSAAGDASNGAPAAPPSETLLVGNERCYVVSAVLMAVKFLVEYVAIAVSVPSVVVDVVQRTVEFLQVRRGAWYSWHKMAPSETEPSRNGGGSRPGVQLAHVPSHSRRRRHRHRWPEEHHVQAPRSVPGLRPGTTADKRARSLRLPSEVVSWRRPIGLASQALEVMMALTPRVRDAIGSQLNAKQSVFLSEFDRVLRVSAKTSAKKSCCCYC